MIFPLLLHKRLEVYKTALFRLKSAIKNSLQRQRDTVKKILIKIPSAGRLTFTPYGTCCLRHICKSLSTGKPAQRYAL
ncbi:hypothetical protein ROSINTL182_05589 [Roseburia intestinalis L1-82]|uniref:Uncharacterized protein n=1 Tax=Roseburia intestinalis L1-82 TaxID=536231 RepID=C7G6S4_9FIRM|nr:hypothetical protein ROSINTL182_05589 [Roseburia intestinalis L1-82]